jgi:hypothetical protein
VAAGTEGKKWSLVAGVTGEYELQQLVLDEAITEHSTWRFLASGM